MNQRFANRIKLSVFAYDYENTESIKSALLSLIPFNIEDEKVALNITNATGVTNNKIIIFELVLSRQRNIKQFLDHLKQLFQVEQREILIEQRSSRLDDSMNFFIRLEKNALLCSYKELHPSVKLTDSGNCLHIKIGVAAYPAKREIAMDLIKTWLA